MVRPRAAIGIAAVLLVETSGFSLAPRSTGVAPRSTLSTFHHDSFSERRLTVCASLSETGAATAIGVIGDDPWVGFKMTDKELYDLVDDATAQTPRKPVTRQFQAKRSSLWRQWKGTIVKSVLHKEVKYNVAWASAIMTVYYLQPPHVQAQWLANLGPIEQLWKTGQTFAAFMLSFFLSKTFEFWQRVYSISRQAQGRCNDIALLAVVNGARSSEGSGDYTPEAEATLRLLTRYIRLSHVVWYASFTRLYAPLATPRGLRALEWADSLTSEETDKLLQTTSWYNTVLTWMGMVLTRGSQGGALSGADTTMIQFNDQLTRLRATYASMGDALSGRMPMAYPHLVQILVDSLCLAAPFALVGPLGCVGAIIGTGLCTLFYSGIMNLAKMFLDPFDNDDYGGRSQIRVEVDTLVQEVNAATVRWENIGQAAPSSITTAVVDGVVDTCLVGDKAEADSEVDASDIAEPIVLDLGSVPYNTAGLFGSPGNGTGLHTLADLAKRDGSEGSSDS